MRTLTKCSRKIRQSSLYNTKKNFTPSVNSGTIAWLCKVVTVYNFGLVKCKLMCLNSVQNMENINYIVSLVI